ncbi:hypothetical protein ASD75_04625 [Acidovorax sp. Root568]|nr:hypothetical protein ASD75_04625 [Acidovorax sp. Root568]
MESDLTSLLQTVCTRVYPGIAPPDTAMPYATYQHIGGVSLVFLDNTPGDKRNSYMQINVWSARSLESMALIRQIEDALRLSPAFIARSQGEPLAMPEVDPVQTRYGAMQRFSLWSGR